MVLESPIGDYTEDLAAMLEGSATRPSAEPIVVVAWSWWSPADIRLTGTSQQLQRLHRGLNQVHQKGATA